MNYNIVKSREAAKENYRTSRMKQKALETMPDVYRTTSRKATKKSTKPAERVYKPTKRVITADAYMGLVGSEAHKEVLKQRLEE